MSSQDKNLHIKCQYIALDLLNKPKSNIFCSRATSMALESDPYILNHFIKYTNECKNDFSLKQLELLNNINNKLDKELEKPVLNKIQNIDNISMFVIDTTLEHYTNKKKIEIINNNKLCTENFIYNNLDISNKFIYLLKKTMSDIIYI
jgi:hypothetical protein